MGTTNLPLFCWFPFCWFGPEPRPALTRFHLARRFWNHIFTCTSLKRNADAIWLRSVNDKYFFAWNSLSNSSNCSLVNAVRRRLAFVDGVPSHGPSDDWDSSKSSSMSDPEIKIYFVIYNVNDLNQRIYYRKDFQITKFIFLFLNFHFISRQFKFFEVFVFKSLYFCYSLNYYLSDEMVNA